MMNRFALSSLMLLLVTAMLAGCGDEDADTGNSVDDAPEDYPADIASDVCGGKCDGTDSALALNPARLVDSLDIFDAVNVDGELETLRFVALPKALAPDVVIEDGQKLVMAIAAVDGASNPDFQIEGSLTYDAAAETFTSEEIDTSLLLPWLALRVDLSGDFGEQAITQSFEFSADSDNGSEVLPEFEDPFEGALEVNAPVIYIDTEFEAPEYKRANVDGFSLGGTEFWQRWPGGENPTFSYNKGSNAGKKCMYASARRFEAIMQDPPESIVKLREESNWSGSFFNWNDDYNHEDANGSPRGPVLWAWRTGLVKFISQTSDDGYCYLPTRDMMERLAASCMATAERDDGEIQGCQAN